MVVQWCDSDQVYGQAMPETMGYGQLTNGCNDPANWTEASAWSDATEAPDCSGTRDWIDLAQEQGFEDSLSNLYCYQATVFEDSPIGDVAACAERLGYNDSKSLTSVGEYMDFLAWIGLLDTLVKFEWEEQCATAVSFANRFNLVEQSIKTSVGACSEGGPVLLQTTNPLTWTVPILQAAGGSGGGAQSGGGGGSCSPPPGGCPKGITSGPYSQGYFNSSTCQCEMCPAGKVYDGNSCVDVN
jgi:hypothetical protein